MNRRHQDFQSCALPTELPAHHEFSRIAERGGSVHGDWLKPPLTLPSPPRGEGELGLGFAALVELGAGVGLEDDAVVVVHREGLVEHEGHLVQIGRAHV